MDTVRRSEEDVTVNDIKSNFAREGRMLLSMGEDLEALGEGLRLLPDRWPYVYNIQLRASIEENRDHLMLVKAVGESGGVIAFHTDMTFVAALRSWPARLRAGKIKWVEDEFPPKNYDRIAAHILAEVEHARKTWWGRFNGSANKA